MRNSTPAGASSRMSSSPPSWECGEGTTACSCFLFPLTTSGEIGCDGLFARVTVSATAFSNNFDRQEGDVSQTCPVCVRSAAVPPRRSHLAGAAALSRLPLPGLPLPCPGSPCPSRLPLPHGGAAGRWPRLVPSFPSRRFQPGRAAGAAAPLAAPAPRPARSPQPGSLPASCGGAVLPPPRRASWRKRVFVVVVFFFFFLLSGSVNQLHLKSRKCKSIKSSSQPPATPCVSQTAELPVPFSLCGAARVSPSEAKAQVESAHAFSGSFPGCCSSRWPPGTMNKQQSWEQKESSGCHYLTLT